jgi:hypothetical protein
MCEKKGTLAFGEKGLHHRVVSGNVTSSLPIAQVICFRARKRFGTIVRKVRDCFGFSLFIGSRHHYPPVSMSYEAMLFG